MMKWVKRFVCVVSCLVLLASFAVHPARAEQQTIKVGFFSADGYHEQSASGIMSGYGYDFLQMLLRYNDWNYEYVGYDLNWGDMLDLLEGGQIDLVTLANKTPEREERFDYSAEPIGVSSTIMTISAQNLAIIPGDYDTYDGARVGLVTGSSHNEKFEAYAQSKGFSFTPVYYEDIALLLRDLRAGRNVDIAVTSNMRAAHDEVILDEFNATDYYAIVRKGEDGLLSQLNAAIAQMDVYSSDWRSDLFAKYYAAINSEVISFSPEERSYLSRLQTEETVIRAVMNPELRPYSYFEDGKPRGIVPELFSRIASRLGIRYEILPAADRAEYKQLLRSGEADIDLTAFQDFGIAQNYSLKETDAYLRSCLAVLTRSGAEFDAASMTVATVTDPTEYAAYNDELLGGKLVELDSLAACAEAVRTGVCDAAYFYAYSAEQLVAEDYTHRLQYTIMPDYAFGLTIGVQNDRDHRLLSILNKGVATLTDAVVQSVTLEELTSHSRKVTMTSFIYDHPLLSLAIAAAMVILLAALLLLALGLRSQQKKALTNRKLNRFIGYICENYDLVTEMNLADRVRTDYYMEGGALVEKSYPYVPLEREDYAKIAHPEDLDKILATSDEERIGKLIDAGGGQDYFEVQVKDETGQYHWYSYLIKAIAKDKNHPRNYIMFKRDIQASKDAAAQQEANLRDALASAQSASASKGQFLSRMSHEIRTPLNAIIGYLAIAKDEGTTPEKIAHCVENSEVAAKHLLQIINDVLDMSSIENGKLKIAHEEFDLKDEISDVTTIFYQNAKAKGVRFETHLDELTEEWVVGDQFRLKQVLMNLLSNAVKFTAEGGMVTLVLRQVSEDEKQVYLQFAVSDTGIGMSEKYLSRLFRPFEQESAATARVYGGSGLGLSITHNLVQMMGGSIAVESRQGEGSTFTVTMHFEKGKGHHFQKPDTVDLSRVRALVMDDQPNEASYVKAMLKRCGVKSDTVASGEEALRRLRSRMGGDYAYDLCILDWNMPEMNGVEVAAKIRAEFGSQMPIIIATAYDVTALEDEARAAGVDRIIAKPLFQSTLFDLLVTTFGHSVQAPEATNAPVKMDGMRLILAEDNAMNMEIAVTVLEKAGIRVDQAVNGQEALNLFLAAPEGTYDLILMDVQMPVMDGYEATRRIRSSSHPAAKTIPIIAMTANAFSEDVAEALSNGMNAHIAKPVNRDKLFQVLREFSK